MRLALLLVIALVGCPGAGVGNRVRSVADAPSGKRLAVYASSSFEAQVREVPEDVVVQAMRASSLFFDEDIRAFAKRIAAELPQLDEDEHLVVETSDAAIHLYVAHDELQVVAFRSGQEVSRHASAIPAAAVKTELAVKARPLPPPEPKVIVVSPPPPNDDQRAHDLNEAALRQFTLANYPSAIASWKEAYLLKSEAMFLYRIGEAYRLSGDCGEASKFYASYQQAQPTPANKAELEASVKACQKPTKTVAKPRKQPAGKKLTEAEIRERLTELDRLLAQQLITRAEYDEKKKTLLDQL